MSTLWYFLVYTCIHVSTQTHSQTHTMEDSVETIQLALDKMGRKTAAFILQNGIDQSVFGV